MDKAELTVFYDGGCPACSREIALYRRRELTGRVAWIDLAQNPEALTPHGVTLEEGMRYLHAFGVDGQRHAGVDAFIEIWRRVPGCRPLAALVGFPGIRALAQLGYRLFARYLRPRLRRVCPVPGPSPKELS